MNEAQKHFNYYSYNKRYNDRGYIPDFCVKKLKAELMQISKVVENWGPDGDKMIRFRDGSQLLYRKLVNEIQL